MAHTHQDYAAMSEQEDDFVLRGKVQVDDAYLGGEHCGGKTGRGSENKVPIFADHSVYDAGHQKHVKLATLTAFSFVAIAGWAQDSLKPGCEVISDGFACFRAVAEVGCCRQAVDLRGRHPANCLNFAGSTHY